ncbi:uncharacterized protein BJ171DRAFT_111576, partial [Polychytrium aggregatum]|uniref:uncharacterized protein n=1 Tax=Polychytrium aggregatum TaxID=110093 RepID=UPI0022FDB7CA
LLNPPAHTHETSGRAARLASRVGFHLLLHQHSLSSTATSTSPLRPSNRHSKSQISGCPHYDPQVHRNLLVSRSAAEILIRFPPKPFASSQQSFLSPCLFLAHLRGTGPTLAMENEMVTRLRSFLQRQVRVVITDGRRFVGCFVCIDKAKNIILRGAQEFKNDDIRYVGLIMIPGKHVVKIELRHEPPKDEAFQEDLLEYI